MASIFEGEPARRLGRSDFLIAVEWLAEKMIC